MSWRMHWQDWDKHHVGMPAPRRWHQDYPSREEAQAAAKAARARLGEGLVVSVVPTPAPKAKNPAAINQKSVTSPRRMT